VVVRELGDIRLAVRQESSFFSLVSCLPSIPLQSSPCWGTLHAMVILPTSLSPGDLSKTSWCWMTEKQNYSPFLALCCDTGWTTPDHLPSPPFCLPSSHSSGTLSLSLHRSYHLPSLLQPSQLLLLSIQICLYIFSLSKHRTSFLRLPTLHHPIHTPMSLCLQSPPPPTTPMQALFVSQCTSS